MIYSVKRFSGDDEKKGMGLGTKLALGTAAIGGTLLAGRAGMLGTRVQKGIGTATAAVGQKIGSQRLLKDGANTVGNAAKTSTINNYMRSAVDGGANINKKALNTQAAMDGKNAAQGILDKFKIEG